MGKRNFIYLSLHCHHQNDSCIKMDSDERHFNVSLIVRDKVTNKTMSTNQNLFEEKGKPKRYRTDVLLLTSLALPLGQSGPRVVTVAAVTLLAIIVAGFIVECCWCCCNQ